MDAIPNIPVDMNNLSTIERTPVEIWREILSQVLKTWLLPGNGDNLLDDLLLFNADCESTLEYTRVESIRRQLRLVCRTWKGLADEHNIALTISDLRDISIPSKSDISRARRIQFPSTWKCICKRCPHQFGSGSVVATSMAYQTTTSSLRGTRKEVTLPFKPERARVILLKPLQRDILDYLQHTPCLSAFAAHINEFWEGKEPQIHTLFAGLTHLCLSTTSPVGPAITLHLQHLKFLDIGFSKDSLSKGTLSRLESWKFPQLTSLRIGGIIDATSSDKVSAFSRSHATTLENLITEHTFVLDGVPLPRIIDFQLLGGLPRLKAFGISILTLDQLSDDLSSNDHLGDYHSPRQLSLLLTDIDIFRNWHHVGIVLIAKQCIRLCTSPTSRFGEVVIPYSWKQLTSKYDAEFQYSLGNIHEVAQHDPFFSASVFFGEIYESNVPFLDREGVDLRGSGGGQEFMRRLEQFWPKAIA
ncbi:hypothetical protein FRC15_000476 [Serendipita sp. 397]|nr:hypothetical protein FRC15_000476 [Serendipita sp. 397]KAG8791479.1 hypothetical protein FRC16_000394 [Serendipita sp. 398]KAG8805152.1 hypothetical protein FRC18_006856 [Serendipita sp. 400]